MPETNQIYRFKWRGIEIEACYTASTGEYFAYLEIKSTDPASAPLSITETGYFSYYHAIGMVEASGLGVIDFMCAWLDEEADNPKWKRAEQARRQSDLFA